MAFAVNCRKVTCETGCRHYENDTIDERKEHPEKSDENARTTDESEAEIGFHITWNDWAHHGNQMLRSVEHPNPSD
jgi:hypothetical protein